MKIHFGTKGAEEMNIQRPQPNMMIASQRDGLVRFIMMLLGISAATYHGKKTASAICEVMVSIRGGAIQLRRTL